MKNQELDNQEFEELVSERQEQDVQGFEEASSETHQMFHPKEIKKQLLKPEPKHSIKSSNQPDPELASQGSSSKPGQHWQITKKRPEKNIHMVSLGHLWQIVHVSAPINLKFNSAEQTFEKINQEKTLELEHFSQPFFKRLITYEVIETDLTFYNQPTPLPSTQTHPLSDSTIYPTLHISTDSSSTTLVSKHYVDQCQMDYLLLLTSCHYLSL